jgi:hypothetical protein
MLGLSSVILKPILNGVLPKGKAWLEGLAKENEVPVEKMYVCIVLQDDAIQILVGINGGKLIHKFPLTELLEQI